MSGVFVKGLVKPAGPREFKQARARRTYAALLSAARSEFSRRGFDATQTPDIAGTAGVSVGTFYRYFTDKREVFLEIARQYLDEVYQEVSAELVLERFVGRGRRAAIDECLRIIVAHTSRDPELQKVIYEMALRDEEVAELRSRIDTEVHRQLQFIVENAVPKGRADDAAALAWVILTATVEVAVSLTGIRGQPPISAERAQRALGALIEQALFG